MFADTIRNRLRHSAVAVAVAAVAAAGLPG